MPMNECYHIQQFMIGTGFMVSCARCGFMFWSNRCRVLAEIPQEWFLLNLAGQKRWTRRKDGRETFRQIGQDDPLGSVAIPITMTPSELKNLRFQLDRVASDPEKIYELDLQCWLKVQSCQKKTHVRSVRLVVVSNMWTKLQMVTCIPPVWCRILTKQYYHSDPKNTGWWCCRLWMWMCNVLVNCEWIHVFCRGLGCWGQHQGLRMYPLRNRWIRTG